MPQLSGDLIRHRLKTHTFGQNVVYIEKIGSTNVELKALARGGAPEGLLYITDEQLAGRGRLKRRWVAPAESSLLFSLLFRPGDFLAPAQAQRLTMICALAMADAIHTQTGLMPDIKWPNDLLWKDGKKLAGILTELEIEHDRLAWVVVGIGVNVNLDFRRHTDLDRQNRGREDNGGPPLMQTATSLSMILGRDTSADRLPILQQFLVNVEQRYDALKQGRLPHEEWSARLAGVGQPATVTAPDRVYRGVVVGVDENGALLLREEDGTITAILAGDVSLR